MTINLDATRVANLIKNKSGIVSVTLSEPDETMLKEIASKYELSTNIVVFTVVYDKDGIKGKHNVAIPESIYSVINDEYLSIGGFDNLGAIIQTWPDTMDDPFSFYLHENGTEKLFGHSLVPIANPSQNLNSLLDALRNVNGISEVFAYEIYNSKKIELLGVNSICFNCILIGTTLDLPHDQLLEIVYTKDAADRKMIQLELPNDIIEDKERHEEIIDNLSKTLG